MKNESQQALLLLWQYLYQQTDEQHPVSVTDILAFWQQHGIQAGRKSVYTDIELLQNAGMDIVCVKSSQNKYFVGQRLFELPELKLLVDAVESSRFITEKKSTALIKKLGHLTSTAQAEQLNRRIYMGGTPKPENESIYYNVDTIHNAVQKKQQITFQYFEYTPKKEKIARPALVGAAVFKAAKIGIHCDLACVQPKRKDFVRHCKIVFAGKLIHGVSSCSSGWKK